VIVFEVRRITMAVKFVRNEDDSLFAWSTVTKEEAESLFDNFEIYELRDDDSESLIESVNDMDSLPEGTILGIELGEI